MPLPGCSFSAMRRLKGRAVRVVASSLAVAAAALACNAQAAPLTNDARRDAELRPAVLPVIISLTASFKE